MKKLLVALLALAMVFAFASCENETKAPYEDWTGIGVRIAKHTNPSELQEGAACEGNYDHVKSATYKDGVITVEAEVNSMASYDSTNPDQGNHKWFALFISVGEYADDESLKINGSATLDQAREGDTDKYEAVVTGDADKAMAADEFVLWAKADGPGSITLSRTGAATLELQIKVVDTSAADAGGEDA